MSEETTTPPEAVSNEIDQQIKAAFQSIRSSLQDLGLTEPFNYKPKGLPRVDSLRTTDKAHYNLGPDLPWPLNSPSSYLSASRDRMQLYWPTEPGKYEAIYLRYDPEDPTGDVEYQRSSGNLIAANSHHEEYAKQYMAGQFGTCIPGKKSAYRKATFDEWETEEKPLLNRVINSLSQVVPSGATTSR